MENEYGYQEGEQQQEQQSYNNQPSNQIDEAPSPTSLADAFAALRKGNQDMDPQDGQEEDAGEEISQQRPDDEKQQEPDGERAGQPEVGSDNRVEQTIDRGSSTGDQSFDVSAYQKNLEDSIRIQAAQMAANDFEKAGYRKLSIMDLRTQDDRGNVTFENPDNKSRPFQSRMEAQAWIDSFNKQVEADFDREARKHAGKLREQSKPMMEMISFMGKYHAMPNDTKEIFDDLIDPYAIMSNGNVIGFKCNLETAARQAEAIAKRFRKPEQQQQQQQQQQQPAQPQRPSMDLPSKGSSSGTVGDPEPKTIAEAIALYQKQKNGGK